MHQKYVVERLSSKEIATQIFSSRSTVAKYLKHFNIPLRPQDSENKTASQLRFGEAWRNHRVVVHKRELEVLGKMRNLREQGLSYWKIADVLNGWGIKTKTGKAKWSAKTVHQVLTRKIS